MPLFALVLTPSTMAIIGLATALTVFVVGWLFRKDTAIEGRRREMIALHSKLESLGLQRLAGFAECYAVGDYSGLYAEAKALVKQVMDADDAMGLLDKSFYLQLPKRLARDGDRERIIKAIDAYKAANPEVMLANPLTGEVKPVPVAKQPEPKPVVRTPDAGAGSSPAVQEQG